MKTVAVIGCGKSVEGKEGWAIGHMHAAGYLACGHEVKLLGVDLSAENLAAFGEKFGVPEDQLFASTEALYEACIPDCVSICTWPALHHPMVVEALEKGVKGIACEKPFALDVGEQRELEQRVKDAGAVLVVGHQRRLEAPFLALIEVAKSGRLGDDLHAQGWIGNDWDILSWTTHWFDMANALFGEPPEYVLAGMDIGTTRRYHHAVEDASIVYAHYGDKGKATFLTGPGTLTEFMIQGSEGLARIGDGCIKVATFDGSDQIPVEGPAGGFSELLKELIEALDGGPEPTCSIGRCAVATEMAYAAHESARTGKKVYLPLSAHYAPLEIAQHPICSGLRGVKVLLYADAHFGSGGREGIADAFAELTGLETTVIDAETQGLAARDVRDVDVVAIYHTQKEADDATQEALTNWVESGKPLMILHAGLGAWPEWDGYTSWCGKIWEWGVSEHPHEPMPLKVVNDDPLRFGWSEAWLPKDEVFIKLKDTSPTRVGMTTDVSVGTFDVAWQNAERPNIGAWMPGHRRDTWGVPAMREGMARTLLSVMRQGRRQGLPMGSWDL